MRIRTTTTIETENHVTKEWSVLGQFVNIACQQNVKLVCVDNRDSQRLLTLGKIYDILNDGTSDFYCVKTDSGHNVEFSARRFAGINDVVFCRTTQISSLTEDKVYVIIPDEKAESAGMFRIVDDDEEEFYYPKHVFRSVS
jgi:3-dehydroquinate synthase class II